MSGLLPMVDSPAAMPMLLTARNPSTKNRVCLSSSQMRSTSPGQSTPSDNSFCHVNSHGAGDDSTCGSRGDEVLLRVGVVLIIEPRNLRHSRNGCQMPPPGTAQPHRDEIAGGDRFVQGATFPAASMSERCGATLG